MLSTSKALFRKPGGAAPTTDATFAYVPLLLETGSASSLNTTVTDSSASLNTVTRVSNPSTGWVSPYQTDGYWGNQFNGTNAYLTSTIPALSGQFTIDFWVYRPASGNNYFFTIGDTVNSTGLEVYIGSSGTALNVYSNGASQITSSTLPTVGSWNYIAVTRDASSQIKLYLNGTQLGLAWGSAVTFATTLRLGVEFYNSGLQYGNSYLSNFRISNNVRTVTSVPTAPFSNDANTLFLSCQSNRFKDNSSNNATITPSGTPQVDPYFYPSGFTAPAASPGAVLLNGSSQYLTAPANSAWSFGTGNFTIEFWQYYNSLTNYQTITSQGYVGGAVAGGWVIQTGNGDGKINFYYQAPAGTLVAAETGTTVVTGTWYHIAVVKNGATVTIYRNGTSVGSGSDGRNYSATQILSIGGGSVAGFNDYWLNGYIGNFRIVKGTAVYTGAFTPPSGPLTQTGGTYPSLTNVVTGFTAANTSLLLAMSDSNYNSATNGVQNNTFIDTGPYAFPITRNGTPTQGSITPYWPNGQWSNYFATTSDYLSTPNVSALQPGSSTTAFSIECWIYPTASGVGDRAIFGNYKIISYPTNSDGLDFLYLNTGSVAFRWGYPNYADTPSSSVIQVNTWNHVVVCRNTSGSMSCYLNGTRFFNTSSNTNITNSTASSFWVGWAGSLSGTTVNPFPGYISNFKFLKNATAYDPTQTTISVPTAPPTSDANTSLLTCQSNRFIDVSGTPKTITLNGTPTVQAFQPFSPTASYTTALYGGSGYFNGSTDYLSLASNAAFNVSGGDWTIEMWIYFSSISTTIIAENTTNGVGGWSIQLNSSGNPVFYVSSILITGSNTIKVGQWNHLAHVRSGSTTTQYLNGVSNGTSASDAGSTNSGLWIGARSTPAFYLNGYISNFRIAKGTAVYTGAFTPPTLAPLATTGPASAASYSSTTNVNTTFLTPASLLLNMTNAGIYDAAVQNDLLTVGSAVTDTTTKQWSPSSTFLNGSANYLTMPANPQWAMSGDWTLEAWIYPTTVSGVQIIINTRNLSAVTSPVMYLNGSNLVIDTGAAPVISAGTISINSWQYVAATRSGNSWKLFIGGSQVGSTTTNTTSYSTAYGCAIGRSSSGENFNGYIQDVRVTKGVARTITASPSAAFPTR